MAVLLTGVVLGLGQFLGGGVPITDPAFLRNAAGNIHEFAAWAQHLITTLLQGR